MEKEDQKNTHGLADLDEGQHAAAQALDLQEEGVVAGRRRGGGARFARRRAVTGDLVAVVVEGPQVGEQGVAGIERGLRALLHVVVAAHGARMRLAGADRVCERGVAGRLDGHAGLAQAGAARALFGLESKNTVARVGYTRS